MARASRRIFAKKSSIRFSPAAKPAAAWASACRKPGESSRCTVDKSWSTASPAAAQRSRSRCQSNRRNCRSSTTTDESLRHQVTTIDGRQQTLADYRGQVLLIVNVASQCGFTPQYAGLESLYQQHKERRFQRAGFSLRSVRASGAGRRSGDPAILLDQVQRHVSDVCEDRSQRPRRASAVSISQSREKSGLLGTEAIKWNFTKFLIDREGEVVKRYAPTTTPEKIAADLLPLLK